MKILDHNAYKEIHNWIYRNARPLDLALWQFYFEDGNKENVVHMLGNYQNEDGGFGNGLEPDCWNTESSPYAVMVAAGILRDIGFIDTSHPMIEGIFRYLDNTDHCSLDGWHFCIPSNDNVPRAPWWTYSEETNLVEGMGITAALCGFILQYGKKDTRLYDKALQFADKILKKVSGLKNFGEMGIMGLYVLLMDLEKCGLTVSSDIHAVKKELIDQVNQSIERDQEKWGNYTPHPSDFIQSAASDFYLGNEEIVEKELDYLIKTRNPGGVWNITWSWFQLTETYAKEFTISENWWMGAKAIEKLRFLKVFGRL